MHGLTGDLCNAALQRNCDFGARSVDTGDVELCTECVGDVELCTECVGDVWFDVLITI